MCWRGTCLYDNQSEKYERNAAGNLLRGTCLSGNYFRNQTETNLLPSEQHAKKTWLILHNISLLWGWDGDDDDGKGKNNLDTYSFFDGYGFDGDSDDDEDDCYGRGGCIGSGGGGIGGRDYDEDEADHDDDGGGSGGRDQILMRSASLSEAQRRRIDFPNLSTSGLNRAYDHTFILPNVHTMAHSYFLQRYF